MLIFKQMDNIIIFLVAKQLYEALMSFCLSLFLSVCNHFLKNASFTQNNQGGVKGSQERLREVKKSKQEPRGVKRSKEE